MNEAINKEDLLFFECLGEIWRDITAIEFLMRCAIAKKDGDISKLPKPPFTINNVYDEYPKSFSHLSFEIIVYKFNKRFPKLSIPGELIHLRDAMAHGIIAEIDNRGVTEMVKFKETKNKELKVEFSMTLELKRLSQIRQSLKELRGYIMKEVNENNSQTK